MTDEQIITVTKGSWIKTNLTTVISIIVATVVIVIFIQNTRAEVSDKASIETVEAVKQRVSNLEDVQDINTELLFAIAKELKLDVTDLFKKYTKIKKEK